MSYQVLARKFRPGGFDEVVGQEPIVRTLRNAVSGDRLAHAYLFSGPRGVGKTTLARILAKCLNCSGTPAPTVEPCGACESCQEIASSSALDVQEIDGASNRGIDDVRELRETSRYQPTRDRFRVFIIDEVHMLTREAFNALLKTLEEPPPHVIFVFATTEYQKVPATITSRCQHFEFRRIERPQLSATLAQVAKREGIHLGERSADLLARYASGSLRDALGYLDQAVAYCGTEVSEDGLREILGVAGLPAVDAFLGGIAAADPAQLLGQVDGLVRSGQDLPHFVREILERVRELLLLQAAGPAGPAVLGMSDGEAAEARRVGESFSLEDLLRLGTSLAELEGRLRFSSHPRFLLEMAAIRLARTPSVVPLADLIARLEAMAGDTPASGGTAPAGGAVPRRTRATPPAGTVPPPPATPTPAVPADSKEEEVRRRVAAKRSALGSYLEHASSFRIDGEVLQVRFPPRHALFRNGLARADNRRILEEACREATGRDLSIDVQISDEGDPEMDALTQEAQRAESRESLLARAMDEPVVRAVMDRFGAKVIRVEERKEP